MPNITVFSATPSPNNMTTILVFDHRVEIDTMKRFPHVTLIILTRAMKAMF